MRPIVGIILSSGLAAAMLAACSAYDEAFDMGGAGGTASSSSGTGTGGNTGDAGIDVIVGDDAGPGVFTYAELCGEGCIPGTGEPAPCDQTPSAGGGGSGGAGGAGGAGGGGAPAAGNCVLTVDEEAVVSGTCTPHAGQAVDSDPCLSAADCGPGLGCVTPGVCRPYCCDALEDCPVDTYCAPVAVADGDLPNNGTIAPEIPVCIPATQCTLLDDTTCPDGMTCTIVRQDGTTSCVQPGEGSAGEPCPCEAGHVCSTGKNTCHQLCHIGQQDDCPEGFSCFGGATSYPDGFGVCVESS